MAVSRNKTLITHFDAIKNGESLRPVMTSLNGDNSWLFSFPRPAAERESAGKTYFHIVFEPWLVGDTSYLTSWVIHIALGSEPAVPSAAAVAQVAKDIEDDAAKALSLTRKERAEMREDAEGDVDAILLGFHYLDHVHEATLSGFSSKIPVIATREAAAKIKPWNRFETVRLISDLPANATTWRSPDLHPGYPMPSWLTAFRMPSHHELNYVLGIVWSHPSSPSSDSDNDEQVHEVLLQSPHGLRDIGSTVKTFLSTSPPTSKLALLHGLKESHAAGLQNTFGAKAGLKLYRAISGARWWVVSHGSELKYSGALMWLLGTKDTMRSLEWALDEERQETELIGGQPNIADLRNGECLVLTS